MPRKSHFRVERERERALDRSRNVCARSCLFLFHLPYHHLERVDHGASRPIPGRIPRSACGPSNSIVTRTPCNLRTSMKVRARRRTTGRVRNKCAPESEHARWKYRFPDRLSPWRTDRKGFSLVSFHFVFEIKCILAEIRLRMYSLLLCFLLRFYIRESQKYNKSKTRYTTFQYSWPQYERKIFHCAY